MSNDTDRKCRKAAVLKYYEDGVPIKNIAEEFNIEMTPSGRTSGRTSRTRDSSAQPDTPQGNRSGV